MKIELQKCNYKKVHIGPARFSLDLSDGSERGEYVDQDYILAKLGRPHRGINLMFCYYPLDESWPKRARHAFSDQVIEFQWDYPYDDYFPYTGGLEGDRDHEPFRMMRDVRRHGQDVILTMTIDPRISDEQIRAIAEDLKTFGRMQLRINHEATGTWFSFGKRASYEEVGAFFCHAAELIHEIAPQIQIIICIGGLEDPANEAAGPLCKKGDPMLLEEAFKNTIPAADIWSVDKYMALHWGWPIDVADETTNQYKRCSVSRTYELTRLSFERYKELNGGTAKPMVMSEFNSDGDVVGPYDQIAMMKEFFKLREEDKEDWLSAITFYQFRDRGRLGLEIEDPNNENVGIEQPILKEYRNLLHSPLCLPVVTDAKEETNLSLRYGSLEDATGIQLTLSLEKEPVFLELNFDEQTSRDNLMICCNERWFYKASGVDFVDLMPLYYMFPDSGKQDDGTRSLTLTFYAPPENGENVEDGHEDWMINYYHTLAGLPTLRVEYDPIVPENKGQYDLQNPNM